MTTDDHWEEIVEDALAAPVAPDEGPQPDRGGFWISTTGDVPAKQTLRCCGAVTASVVHGRGTLRGMSDSAADRAGVRAEDAERLLAEMYREAMTQLRRQAGRFGANAIIGLRITRGDLGDRNLIHLSADGTAVVVAEG
ncbi:MAG: heavy metal-binding domain-containing protein [Planctomycetota bacterium]